MLVLNSDMMDLDAAGFPIATPGALSPRGYLLTISQTAAASSHHNGDGHHCPQRANHDVGHHEHGRTALKGQRAHLTRFPLTRTFAAKDGSKYVPPPSPASSLRTADV